MNATQIIAIRHGETDWNLDARIQGHTDIPLNDTGLWQAEQLAQALADEPLAHIYSSDLLRAWATAQALSRANGAARNPLLRQRLAKAEIGLRLMRYGALRMLSNSDHSKVDGAALTYKIQWASWRRARASG